MKLVLAGSSQQARDWAHDRNINPAMYQYITDVNQVLLHQPEDSELVFIGSWYASDMVREIVDILMTTNWRHVLEKEFNAK